MPVRTQFESKIAARHANNEPSAIAVGTSATLDKQTTAPASGDGGAVPIAAATSVGEHTTQRAVTSAPAPGALRNLVVAPLRLLSGVLEAFDLPSGLAPGDPVRPAPVQTLLGGLDLVRRQLEASLASRTPYATLVYSMTQTLVDINPLRTTTKGIDVYNLTDKPLTLVAYGSKERALNGPAVGTVVQPGGVLRFEVIYNFLRRTTVKPEFEVVGDPASTTYAMELITTEFNEAAVRCTASGGSGQCFAGSAKYILGSTVSMTGAPGTQITVEASDAATQSRFLNNLCNEDARTSCTFTPTREDKNAYTDKHQVSYEENNSSSPIKRTITFSETQSQTDSVSVTAKASRSFLDKIVNLEISVAYGHTWTGSHTFTKSYETTIPAGYAAVAYAENPIFRVYGDFQMLLPGDTKVVIKNTTWDTPDPKRTVKYDFRDERIEAAV